MNPGKTLLLLQFLLCAATAAAQSAEVRFRVADRATREAVVGAVAELRSRTDTAAAPLYTTSDIDGRGTFPRVPHGDYRLTVTSLGYDSLRRDLRVGAATVRLDSLWLAPRAEAIDQVTVEAPALRSSVRGDTLSYRASAYKVSFGADAESLISKMPGLEVADGGIEAQGRTVQRVYVDGREFFGNDVMSAIRNIPADMIESIDIYNSQSDQSEFTGVDTGEGHTSLNIVTLPDKRRGAFGRLYGAYGIADKYIGGGNVNIFDNDRRISVVGLANNISRQNFSFEDILGTTDRSGRKSPNNSFMVRPLDGISTVQAIGVNYSDDWGAKGKVTASYFFNRTDNRNTSQSDRQTFTSTDKLVLYNDENRSKTLNLNHRFNSRIDYKFSDRHSVMMRTSFSLQDNNSRNELRSRTDNKFSDDDIRFVYRRRNFGHNNSDGYNVSNYLLYRYRLPGAKSHNLTVGAGGTYRSYEQLSRPRQYTFRDPDNIECDTSDYSSRNITRTDRDQPGYDVNGNVSYTRSLSKRSRLSFEYRINYTDNSVERNTFVLTKENVFPDERNPKQSTEYDYAYLTHRIGSTYQYYFKKTKIAGTLHYQHAAFSSDYAFPYARKTETSFDNLTYSVVANINVNRNNTLKFNASGRTSNPRATDLQDIVNTTNRQNVFAGNPGLDPVYTHRLSGQYIRANPAKGHLHRLGGSDGQPQHHHRLAGDRLAGFRDRRRRDQTGRRQPVHQAGQPRGTLEPARQRQLRHAGPVAALEPQFPGGHLDGPHPEHHQRRTQLSEQQRLQCRPDARQQHLGSGGLPPELHGPLQREPEFLRGAHARQHLFQSDGESRDDVRPLETPRPARQRRLQLLPGDHGHVPRRAADLQRDARRQALPQLPGRSQRRSERHSRPERHDLPPHGVGNDAAQRDEPGRRPLRVVPVHLQPASFPPPEQRRDGRIAGKVTDFPPETPVFAFFSLFS